MIIQVENQRMDLTFAGYLGGAAVCLKPIDRVRPPMKRQWRVLRRFRCPKLRRLELDMTAAQREMILFGNSSSRWARRAISAFLGPATVTSEDKTPRRFRPIRAE